MSGELGGQFNIAKTIPGKEEFHETIRYFNTIVNKSTINVKLHTKATVTDLQSFDHVVIATGVKPL